MFVAKPRLRPLPTGLIQQQRVRIPFSVVSCICCWGTTVSAWVDTIVRQKVNYRNCQAMLAFSSSSLSSPNDNDVVTTMSKIQEERKNLVAVAQMCSTSNKVQNLLDIAQCAAKSKQQNARMLFLPEACGYMGESAAETVKHAEPPIRQVVLDGNNKSSIHQVDEENQFNSPEKNPEWLTKRLEETYLEHFSTTDKSEPTKSLNNDNGCDQAGQNGTSSTTDAEISLLDGLQTIARMSQLWISVGGLHVRCDPATSHQTSQNESDADNPRVYNTHLILDSQGRIRALYRKIHLFDVCIPGKVQLRESNSTAPGHDIVLCDTPIGRIGLTTCYDVRFPELYIKLVEKGAQIMLVPSAFTVPTGKAHWHILLRARAVESQCYVIAAAQYGSHNTKRTSYGHSLVVDPWGTELVDAGGIDSETSSSSSNIKTPNIVTAEVDLEHLDSIRQRLPIRQHRQAAEYS